MPHRVIDLIRQSVESKAFPQPLPSLQELRKSEWSPQFEQLMRNRLLMGAFRYGLLETKRHYKWKLLESIRSRLDRYEQEGNTELLVDVANLCLLEFEFPSVEGAYFQAGDDNHAHVQRID